jgi:hypothetical protein
VVAVTPVQLFFAGDVAVVAWWKAIRRAWFSEAVIITLGLTWRQRLRPGGAVA